MAATRDNIARSHEHSESRDSSLYTSRMVSPDGDRSKSLFTKPASSLPVTMAMNDMANSYSTRVVSPQAERSNSLPSMAPSTSPNDNLAIATTTQNEKQLLEEQGIPVVTPSSDLPVPTNVTSLKMVDGEVPSDMKTEQMETS